MKNLNKIIPTAALFAGPSAAAVVLVLPLPQGLSQPALSVAAIALWMAIWWMTEAVALAVTALLPLALFPVLGIGSIDATAANYAHPLIFLFLGGFLMAQTMQRWGLSQRIAHFILRRAGDRPADIVASIMVATALLSMWVSNTATAMMMLPIGQSIVKAANNDLADSVVKRSDAFCTALMLGIAYAATIGGMGTLIGTPPNALFAGFMAESYGIEISFARWMQIGIPAVVVLLPIAWLVLTRVAFSLPQRLPGLTVGSLNEALGQRGRMTTGEKRVAVLLVVAAIGWMLRPLINTWLPGLNLSDAGIAIAVTVLLFVTPGSSAPRQNLLNWDEARNVRWDVLILFGGGLALADAIASTGLASWIGTASSAFAAMPWLGLVLLVTAVIVLLGELASNTAIAAVFLPVAGAAAIGLGANPALLTMSVALAASLGFMLPVATPPNAIVYGSGEVAMQDMLRAGILLDLLGIITVAILAVAIGPMIFAE